MDVYSKDVQDRFKIYVRYPLHYNVEQSYSIIYVLDANIYFNLVTGAAKLLEYGDEIEECIYVGIGYHEDSEHLVKRNRDYLPTNNTSIENSGHAKKFQTFLQEFSLEFEKEVNVGKRYLFGDSFSGLYCLFELFTNDSFDGYVVGSPSIYWDESAILKFYEVAELNNKRKIFISVGELEAKYEPEFAGMVRNMELMRDLLQNHDIDITSHIFENETHLSVIPATFSRGLRIMVGKKV